jgi:hypothetical protein
LVDNNYGTDAGVDVLKIEQRKSLISQTPYGLARQTQFLLPNYSYENISKLFNNQPRAHPLVK